jgi:hypothetical protein
VSLEDAVHRLANVISTQTNEAVAEIIRQRDAWQERAQELERTRDYLSKRRDELFDEGRAKDRKIIALRGVITRMKNNARPGAGDEREA